jgi:hypothetical protein
MRPATIGEVLSSNFRARSFFEQGVSARRRRPLNSGRRRLDAVPPRIQAGRSLGLRDEAVVKDIMATINGGDVSALPPIHL